MIEPIDIGSIPPIRDERRFSPLRGFADETVAAFGESGAEAAIVTDAPDGYKTNQIVTQLRNAIGRVGKKSEMKITQRKSTIYIVKVSTLPKDTKILKIPTSNPRRRK